MFVVRHLPLHKITKEERVLVKRDLIDSNIKFIAITLSCLNPCISI